MISAIGLAVPGRLPPLDLTLAPGTLTFLVGPNGAGKTTLLRALAGIEGAGAVRIAGCALAALPPAERVRTLGFLPASRELRWPLRARDLVALGLGGRRDDEAVERALERVHALALADRPADQLSTGERARVLLARVLAAEPAVLLLDEPIANLDPLWQLRILALLRAEADAGRTVLASIHDLTLADRADRLLVVDHGRIVADDAPDVALSPALLAATFGIARAAGGWVAA